MGGGALTGTNIARLHQQRWKITASDRSRGEGDGSEAAPGRWLRLAPAGNRDGLEFGHALFQFVDLGAGAGQHPCLDIEFLAGDQVEAAQSLRQNILEGGAQILLHLCQSWRYQRHKPQMAPWRFLKRG